MSTVFSHCIESNKIFLRNCQLQGNYKDGLYLIQSITHERNESDYKNRDIIDDYHLATYHLQGKTSIKTPQHEESSFSRGE